MTSTSSNQCLQDFKNCDTIWLACPFKRQQFYLPDLKECEQLHHFSTLKSVFARVYITHYLYFVLRGLLGDSPNSQLYSDQNQSAIFNYYSLYLHYTVHISVTLRNVSVLSFTDGISTYEDLKKVFLHYYRHFQITYTAA